MSTTTETAPSREFISEPINVQEVRLKQREANESLNHLRRKLILQHMRSVPYLYQFVHNNLELDRIDAFETEVSSETEQTPDLPSASDSPKLYVNLQRVNRYRWPNDYFRKCYEKLEADGWLIGTATTIGTQNGKAASRRRKLARELPYMLHFTYARVLPKLPLVGNWYVALAKGQERVLSKAEILGRLVYCGFRIVAVQQVGHDFFFMAQKNGRPRQDAHPSYAFLIKLKRLGLNGKTIYINKLRTMYPYSEYLQEYVYQQNKLDANGKFKDDFRITGWGKILRKLWIDELPQLINLLKGDLRLVGVRALSEHYLSLYPKDLQELRGHFKPGLVPPYYVDLPQTFDEIVESERRYLRKKQAHPIKTDIEYFFKAGINIVFRRARSN